jgi:hypothetical protein
MATIKKLPEIRKLIAAGEKVGNVKVSWLMKPKAIVWANGSKGVTAMVKVEAPGYHPTKFHYSEMNRSWWLRPLGHCK